jgi:hypothetical protein
MRLPLLLGAASAVLSQPVLAAPVGACAPAARQAAVAHIENGPAIGQVTSPGSAFALDPHRLRFEVDVFGPQTYIYRVDVTVDGRCNPTDFDTQLLNNPWGGAR